MRNDKIPSSVETRVYIDGAAYNYNQISAAIRYAKERGVLSIITPNPDRTVYEVDAPPPVPNVGQDFKYIGTPGIPSEVRAKLGNIDLPRGEAGDDYARLQERVTSLEKRYEADRFQLVTNFKSLETWLTKLHSRLEKIHIGSQGVLFVYEKDREGSI